MFWRARASRQSKSREAMTNSSVVTLERHIVEEERTRPEATGAFSNILYSITLAAKIISREVNKAGIVDLLGGTGDRNVQGERVQKLDLYAEDVIYRAMDHTGALCCMVSEESEDILPIPEKFPKGKYVLIFDPLDGSSNIDVAISIGSIFGIWRRNGSEPVTDDSLLRPGHEQVAAAYVVYGSSTVMVTATRNSVQGFTLDHGTGSFAITHPGLRIPEACPYYSTNEGNFKTLDEATQQAVTSLRDTYSLRYVGSLVADFHRNLLKGGIFLYPADVNRPEGRLRLMYEANPLGFVAEQAGGAASTGRERIMDIVPEQLHQRTPLILGNKDVVEKTVRIVSG